MPVIFKALARGPAGPTSPNNPQNLTVNSVTSSTVTLSWTAPVGGAGTYNVYRNGVVVAAISGHSALTQIDTGLSSNTTFTYWVTAVNGFGEGPRSNSVFPQTSPPAAGTINFSPGFYFGAGSLAQYNGLSDFQTNINLMRNLPGAVVPTGLVVVFLPNQIEGAQGDFSAWFTSVQGVLTFAQSLNLKPIICVNITGNVGSAAVPGYMLNNATYGQVVSGTGYKGGLFSGPSAGSSTGTVNTLRFDIPATAARIAAWGTALYNQFGTDIYGFDPCWSEVEDMSSFVPQMSPTNIVNSLCGVGGMYDQLRAGMPLTWLMSNFSYQPTSVMAQIFACMDRNKISCGAYDFTNEQPVRTGGAARIIPTEVGFRGGQYVSGVFTPVSGLIDRRANVVGGGRDFWGHLGPDELGNSTAGNPVPPTRLGDGDLLNAIWPQQQLMQLSHLLIYNNRQTGPRCNATSPSGYTPPANYASATWANLPAFFNGRSVSATTYPSFW